MFSPAQWRGKAVRAERILARLPEPAAWGIGQAGKPRRVKRRLRQQRRPEAFDAWSQLLFKSDVYP
jgi:hypothetical protein